MRDLIYNIITKYRRLKNDPDYQFIVENPLTQSHHCQSERNNELNKLIDKLDDISVRELKQCKANVMLCIDEIVKSIHLEKLHLPLARNQGLIIQNWVYGKVLDYLISALNCPTGFGNGPFYYEREGDFDSGPLKELLVEFKNNLNKKDFANYLQFEAFIESYIERITHLWELENELHPHFNYKI